MEVEATRESSREGLERLRRFAQAQADEAARFLALDDEDLTTALAKKYGARRPGQRGWGDPDSPRRYLGK